MNLTRTSFALTAMLALAACDRAAAPDPAASDAASVPASDPAPVSPGPSASVQPPAPPASPDLSAPVLVPEAEKGEKGARNVLLEFARAVERGEWERAAAQFGENGTMSASELKALFGPLGRVTVGFGDGDVEGGAGSLYYGVPLTATGNGRSLKGEIVLRRVNDVAGASAAQLRWHIDRLDLQ